MGYVGVVFNYFSSFIEAGKEISRLVKIIQPQYKEAVKDLYEINQKLLKSNEYVSRWLHQFRYFDFINPNARSNFLNLITEYNTMKNGPEFQKMKFSCHEIKGIYERHIESKIGDLFTKESKKKEIKSVFSKMGSADNAMLEFIYEDVVGKLDNFVKQAEDDVDYQKFDEAEKKRLEFKKETRDLALQLELFNDDLTELVMKFADIAKVPITLR